MDFLTRNLDPALKVSPHLLLIHSLQTAAAFLLLVNMLASGLSSSVFFKRYSYVFVTFGHKYMRGQVLIQQLLQFICEFQDLNKGG